MEARFHCCNRRRQPISAPTYTEKGNTDYVRYTGRIGEKYTKARITIMIILVVLSGIKARFHCCNRRRQPISAPTYKKRQDRVCLAAATEL